jgi:hypothetical protein
MADGVPGQGNSQVVGSALDTALALTAAFLRFR